MAIGLGILSAIIILNAKYYPQSMSSAANVGATSFTFSVMRVLSKAGLLRGLILYQREERILASSFVLERRDGVLCAILSFNFTMAAVDVQNTIAAAVNALGNQAVDSCMLYYQTDTLLSYHPAWLPCCVTHHGPFYNDFARRFSPHLAAMAFGSDEKARHLQHQQDLGIRYLKLNDNAFVLQHSQLQREHLLRNGIDRSRIRKLSPPIQLIGKKHFPAFDMTSLVDFADPDGQLIFTTIARLDFFKNIELLVDSGVELLHRGLAVNVFVAGDDDKQDDRRIALLQRVPPELRHRFHIVPKLTKTELFAFFNAARGKGIFVCPSRFETLGITPLEAALSGVTTLISDARQVEASRYFPAEYRFRANIKDLADLVEGFVHRGISGHGDMLIQRIKKAVSEQQFDSDLLRAWSDFSSSVKPAISVKASVD